MKIINIFTMEIHGNALRINLNRLREAGVAGSIPVTPTI